MPTPLILHPDRLFPAETGARAIAQRLYAEIADLPIISPHGHCDPAWFATDAPWTDATALLLVPDHYLFRMLHSQGIALDALGVPSRAGPSSTDPRTAWRTFAENQHLFRGTPSALWLDHVFAEVFGFEVRLAGDTADEYYDGIADALATPEFRPRALFDRFDIALLATTEGPNDRLQHHQAIRASGWRGRVVTTYRPDAVIEAEHEQFAVALDEFGALNGEDVHVWEGYLRAHRARRADFKAMGATATDHGHPTARTADLSSAEAEALFARVVSGTISASPPTTRNCSALKC